MRQTSARILRALHEGNVLKRIVDRCEEDPDIYVVMTWQAEDLDSEPFIETVDRPRAYRRDFSQAAYEDLAWSGLIQRIPNTGTNALLALTPDGLAKAQELYGPIAADVLVKHDDGVEILPPGPGCGPAVPTGKVSVPDFLKASEPAGP